eukprot:3875346-Rhodomonas_salina.2
MSGTDLAYGAIGRRACYAMPATELARVLILLDYAQEVKPEVKPDAAAPAGLLAPIYAALAAVYGCRLCLHKWRLGAVNDGVSCFYGHRSGVLGGDASCYERGAGVLGGLGGCASVQCCQLWREWCRFLIVALPCMRVPRPSLRMMLPFKEALLTLTGAHAHAQAAARFLPSLRLSYQARSLSPYAKSGTDMAYGSIGLRQVRY